jgi:pSer/pThr/pTyr-binding forkhead associated (FHA) protein
LPGQADDDHPTALHDTVVIEIDSEPSEPISLEGVPEGVPAVLVVRQGPMRVPRIHLDSEQITIGRHPDSDIFFDDVTVSRRHAEIHRVHDGFEVTDAGSLNGTYVNQERVEHGRLSNGDELQVGKFKLMFLALGGSS